MHLLTQSALLKALGWSLFNSLWQMGLLWLFYLLFTTVFYKWAARVRHSLALVLLTAGAVWSGWTFLSAWLSGGGGGRGLEGFGWFWQTARTGRSLFAAVLPYGSTLYLLVLGILLVRYSLHYRQIRKLTHTGLLQVPPELSVFVATTARKLGITPAVRVWLSSLVEVPLTLGSLRPVILLPLAMINNLTMQQVEAIVVHELAHIRRNDYLINLGMTVLELLFFFNPFTRRLIGQIRKERENCCDDQVLQLRYDPHSYVSALLSLAQGRQGQLAVAATGGGNNQLLLQRARRILHQKKVKGEGPGLRSLVLLLLLVTGLITLSLPVRPGRRGTPAVSAVRGEAAIYVVIHPAPPGVNTEPATAPLVNKMDPAPARKKPLKQTATISVPVPEEAERLPAVVLAAVHDAAVLPDAQPAELVEEVRKTPREYSILMSPSRKMIPTSDEGQQEENFPFVPNSSFSFQYIEEDTIRPDEKLLYLQQRAQQEIALEMRKLQLELLAQLEKQRVQPVSMQEKYQKQQLFRQQQSEQFYQRKMEELRQRMKKAGGRLTIVYI